MWTREDGIRHLKPLQHHTPEHVDSEAYGINERRQVVGVSCDADFVDCRAVIWDHGNTPTDLNDLKGGFSARLETAKDINDKGEITGRTFNARCENAVFGGARRGTIKEKTGYPLETQERSFAVFNKRTKLPDARWMTSASGIFLFARIE